MRLSCEIKAVTVWLKQGLWCWNWRYLSRAQAWAMLENWTNIPSVPESNDLYSLVLYLNVWAMCSRQHTAAIWILTSGLLCSESLNLSASLAFEYYIEQFQDSITLFHPDLRIRKHRNVSMVSKRISLDQLRLCTEADPKCMLHNLIIVPHLS